MFVVAPDIDTESLLANACESLASASVMISDFATLLEDPHRNTMLGIQQVIMLGELAVNRALDNIDPQQ
jgi:2-succinyl-5-enolpyruvyl-6-hydroxy-3-cyclohexene-1-carboxylate synthase